MKTILDRFFLQKTLEMAQSRFSDKFLWFRNGPILAYLSLDLQKGLQNLIYIRLISEFAQESALLSENPIVLQTFAEISAKLSVRIFVQPRLGKQGIGLGRVQTAGGRRCRERRKVISGDPL